MDWIKYNIDEASRSNPGASSYDFCLREYMGDILYAECKTIEETSNTVAEAKVILEACKHYRKEEINQVIIETDSLLLYKVITGV